MFRQSSSFITRSKGSDAIYAINPLNINRGFFKIVPQYQQGVRLTFGKFTSNVQPGLRLNIPIIHQIYLLDTRQRVCPIPPIEVISLNGDTFEVDAFIQYKITNTNAALLNVENIFSAIVERCGIELRSLLSTKVTKKILEEKSEISQIVMKEIKPDMDKWGIDVSTVQIRDIKFNTAMKTSMAAVADATRQAEAKVINATADIETAKQYNEAAKIYAENPLTMRLREYQLWHSVSKNSGATIYVVPSNLLDFFKEKKDTKN